MALPVVSKAGAKVDIKCLGDVYGVLNRDKDRSNLGRGVKTFTTFLHLESKIITIILIGLYELTQFVDMVKESVLP